MIGSSDKTSKGSSNRSGENHDNWRSFMKPIETNDKDQVNLMLLHPE